MAAERKGLVWQELVYSLCRSSRRAVARPRGRAGATSAPPLVYSSRLAELPRFSYRVSSFGLLYFDGYVKLAFILILMSVFQLL